MGYWVYHEKATLNKNADGNIYEASRLKTEAEINLFQKYFQKIKFKEFVNTITILKDYEEIEKEKALYRGNLVFHKSEKKKIKQCISENNLSHLKKEIRRYGKEKYIHFYKIEIKDGFYTENIFECTFKDVNGEFFKKYPEGEH